MILSSKETTDDVASRRQSIHPVYRRHFLLELNACMNNPGNEDYMDVLIMHVNALTLT